MTGFWILCASVNFFRSMPRYTLTMFPIFILFALLVETAFGPASSRPGHYCFSRCLPCYLRVVNGHSDIFGIKPQVGNCERLFSH